MDKVVFRRTGWRWQMEEEEEKDDDDDDDDRLYSTFQKRSIS